MKLGTFISWSGDRSQQLAQELRWWLPRVLPAVRPWMSSRDLQKGQRWSQQVGLQLQDNRIGIICVTPENLSSEWMLFEAGALSKTFGDSLVCPVLLGIHPTELDGPLSQFQTTVFNRADMLALIRTLNAELQDDRSDDDVLVDSFDKFWPELEQRVQRIAQIGLGAQSVSQVVRTFVKHGLAEPRIGSEVWFESGFESHGIYETVCSVAENRLWIFGRKNRKLFDKEHLPFFQSLPAKIAAGFDFRCLFLDPDSPDHVIRSAHEDPDFRQQLDTALAAARRVLLANGIDPASCCRTYSFHRGIASIFADDAVLYSRIRCGPTGIAHRLTKSPFSIVRSGSFTGRERIADFEEVWANAAKFPPASA